LRRDGRTQVCHGNKWPNCPIPIGRVRACWSADDERLRSQSFSDTQSAVGTAPEELVAAAHNTSSVRGLAVQELSTGSAHSVQCASHVRNRVETDEVVRPRRLRPAMLGVPPCSVVGTSNGCWSRCVNAAIQSGDQPIPPSGGIKLIERKPYGAASKALESATCGRTNIPLNGYPFQGIITNELANQVTR
jgi:hypothetical protein